MKLRKNCKEQLTTPIRAWPKPCAQDPLGVGYNNVGFAYNPVTGEPNEGLAIIPIDLNANGRIDPDEDFYRSPMTSQLSPPTSTPFPRRVLYLVTKASLHQPSEISSAGY